MGRTVNWDEVPDSTLLPQELYEFEVEDLTEETSKAGHLMYRGVFRVTSDKFTGTPLFDYFTVGTAEDPTAADPLTWKNSFGVRRLKRLFKATQVPMSPDVDEMVEAVKQQRFVGAVSQEVDDGVRNAQYKGVKRNRIDAMYPVGAAKPTAVAATPAPVAPKAAPAAKTPARAAVKAAPTVPCPYCGEAVARNGYVQHVAEQHPNEG
jgi:hypothetical protein